MKIRFFLLLTVFFTTSAFAGCNTTTTPETPPDPKPAVPQDIKDQATCEKHDGTWQRMGRIGRYGCVLPAPDAGKTCTDSAQCTYRCFAKPGDNTPIGQAATGQCQANSSPFGCRTEIVDGKVQPTLCVD